MATLSVSPPTPTVPLCSNRGTQSHYRRRCLIIAAHRHPVHAIRAGTPRTHRPCLGAGFCPARHTALLVPLRRGRRPRRPALPRSLLLSVGATLAVVPPMGRQSPPYAPQGTRRAGRTGSSAPYKIMPCRAGPMCPAVPPYPLQKPVIAKPVRTLAVAIRTPKRLPYDPLPYTQNSLRKPRLPEGILCPISIFP